MGPDLLSQLARLERENQFHARLRELLLIFSRGVSSTHSLPNALETVTHEITHMLGARRTSVWLHDRRARQLSLVASSDVTTPLDLRVSVDDPTEAAARGLRMERARFLGAHLVAPLRGWRRALGTLVIERGPEAELDTAQLVDFAHETARQLSAAIETVQLLDEILRQRRLLEDTFNSLVDLVAVVGPDLQIVQTNEAFATRVGLRRDQLLSRPIRELVGPETAAWIEAAEPDKEPTPIGTRPVEDARLGGTFLLTATPLINDAGQIAGRVLVARDITRQTRLEHERAALRERLAQSEKLASLGQFVAGIAHEMNNPLQGVLGHLELLIATSPQAKPIKRELKQIFQDADRAAKIVRNLLVFTGSRRMARRRLQVDRIVSRALASRAASFRRCGIEVVRVQGENLPAILGDPLLLLQAVLNIVINAEHAVANQPPERRRVGVQTATDGRRERVTVTVSDLGPGIPADVLPRIFDPFFTTKEVGQGTGLGLAITYGIVQEHGGTIGASNGSDGGALFRIDLPAAGEVVK